MNTELCATACCCTGHRGLHAVRAVGCCCTGHRGRCAVRVGRCCLRLHWAEKGRIEHCAVHTVQKGTVLCMLCTAAEGQLVPTLTNRANYIHWIEDLLTLSCPPGAFFYTCETGSVHCILAMHQPLLLKHFSTANIILLIMWSHGLSSGRCCIYLTNPPNKSNSFQESRKSD